MEIRDMVLHPAQVEEVSLIKLNCEKNDEFNKDNTEIGIGISVSGEQVDSYTGKTLIEVNIDGTGFTISVILEGIVTFDVDIPEEQVIKFLEVQGVRILWSYVREVIYDISGRMLRKPIMLPTIDVMKTIENSQEG